MSTDERLLDEIVRFTQKLVRIPSQTSLDSLDPIFHVISEWLVTNHLSWEFVRDDSGHSVAILVTVDSGKAGPTIVLNACADTAPIGRADAWSVPPLSGVVEDGKLYGRGAADSKVAVSIFCHLVRDLYRSGSLDRGRWQVLLDGDEHSGNFGGVKAFIARQPTPMSFVAIGYPGNDAIVIGARGFYRVKVCTFGKEAHSGSSDQTNPQNAIIKMMRLIDHLSTRPLPVELDNDFSFGPRVNVTEIEGGSGFSQIPGQCEVKVDFRLTPEFNEDHARQLILESLSWIDAEFPTERPSSYEETATWPWYKLDREEVHVQTLRDCAEKNFRKSVELRVCGPSNIGNFLATHGIPATCGFGVTYENLHAANECLEINSILPVYKTYRCAVRKWSRSELRRVGSPLHNRIQRLSLSRE